jgi:hypothetical protein
MVGQGPGPGVPHPEDPEQPPDIMRGCGQLDERVRRGAAEAVVPVVLGAADAHPPRLGSGADDRTGGDRQKCQPPRCSPGVGVEAMTLGATAVAAGVVHVRVRTTMIAWQPRPTEGRRPAPEQSIHGAAMAGQEVLAEPVPRVRAVAPEDVRHRWPACAPAQCEIGHEGREGGRHDVEGVGRPRRVARGGTQVLVAEPRVHDPPRPPAFQPRGGIGVPPGRQGGSLGEAALPPGCVHGLVASGRGQGRRPVPSGEHPRAGPHGLPGLPPPRQHPRGQRHAAVLAPLALAHAHQPALSGEVRDLPLGPFPQAQPAGIAQRQTRPGVGVFDPGHHGAHGLWTQHDGPCVAVPGTDALEDRPRALQGALRDEPDPVEMEASRALGNLRLLAPGEAVLPERRCTDVIGSPPIVLGQGFDGVAVARLGPGGQAPQWQVFPHAASERSHRYPPVRDESHGSKRSTRIRRLDCR